MTKLECSVTNCFYNDDKCCCKGDIIIEGRGAHNAGDTCCSSFRERKGDMARNAVSAPKKNIEVDCKACNCVHNKDCKCDAEKIGIAGGGACQCAETECMTFCCK